MIVGSIEKGCEILFFLNVLKCANLLCLNPGVVIHACIIAANYLTIDTEEG